MTKKRIAIDISPLQDGNSIRGVGYYTKQLVKHVQNEIKTNPDYSNYIVDLVTNKYDSNKYDLIHYPYFDPFFLTLPTKKTKTIVTIHDLIPIEYPSHFPVGLKGQIKWLIQKFKVKHSDYIITVSHTSKHIIKDILKYPEDQIYVTHEAADESFKTTLDKNKLDSIQKKYNLPKKFVMYLGDINWNKNIPTLVKACNELKYPLIIVGSSATKKAPDHPWTKDIHWLQNFSEIHRNIKLLGFVPDEDLPLIFNLATIYCQPSYAEGFGLPLVQAMKCGTPIIYSQDSCLPEIMDYSGEFFDPLSITDLKNKLHHLWLSPKLRRHYSELGKKRSTFFDWKFTAIQTLEIYRIALLE